jgi:hypothetical protein
MIGETGDAGPARRTDICRPERSIVPKRRLSVKRHAPHDQRGQVDQRRIIDKAQAVEHIPVPAYEQKDDICPKALAHCTGPLHVIGPFRGALRFFFSGVSCNTKEPESRYGQQDPGNPRPNEQEPSLPPIIDLFSHPRAMPRDWRCLLPACKTHVSHPHHHPATRPLPAPSRCPPRPVISPADHLIPGQVSVGHDIWSQFSVLVSKTLPLMMTMDCDVETPFTLL